MRPGYAGRMNAAHLHLVVNHVPLFGLLAGIALLTWGIITDSREVRLVARVTFIIAGLSGIAVYVSGKGAEDIVENLPGTFERLIERHEDAATIALVGIALTGIVGAVGIAIDRAGATLKRIMVGALYAVSLATLAFTGYAANLGAQIQHPEISETAVQKPH